MSQKKTRDDPMAMQRGDYRNPLLPVFIFCLGRLINIPIQLGIITRIPLSNLISRPAPPAGGHPINLHLPSPINSFFYPFLPKSALSNDTLTLTPYQALIAFMSTWLVTKHLIWVTCLRRERLTINFSIVASIMDGVFEALESFAFTFAAVNPFFSGKMVLLGLLMHVPAVLLELVAEVQRKRFKDDKRNEGKICMRGAWGMGESIFIFSAVFLVRKPEHS